VSPFPARRAQAGDELVDVQEWTGRFWFTDVGAIAYHLEAVPWLVPGFSVRTHARALLGAEEQRRAGHELAFTARSYLIEARSRSARASGL
jgi:hypothetical protein